MTLNCRNTSRSHKSGAPEIFLLLFLALFLFSSCGSCKIHFLDQDDPRSYTFLTYNVHNLFDDQDDNTEYPEYQLQNGKWSREKYLKKLENIGKVLKESCVGGADFIALYEVENHRVLEDLVKYHLDRMGYHTFTAIKTLNSAISIGFISRLPVVNYRSHQPPSKGFPQRPIVEVEVDCGGNPVTVFLCHFKSKSEGAEATQQNRVASAEVIRRRMMELLEEDFSREILLLGDLNENIDEFDKIQGRYATALIPLSAAHEESPGLRVSGDIQGDIRGIDPTVLLSPWLFGGEGLGSYFYRGQWETIDHVLFSVNLAVPPRLQFKQFKVIRLPYLLTSSGEPNIAYSDHLPLWVEFVPAENF